MNRITENKIILVTRRTRLDDLVARFNTVSQARFYIEHLGADFSDYLTEHDRYRHAVADAKSILMAIGRVQILDRSFLPNFIFGKEDTLVVLGQDGLVANTVKYSASRPIIGVNPDPERWDGILVPFCVADLSKVVPQVFAQNRQIKKVTMAKAQLNNGQVLYGVNDLFIGVKSHTSARYIIRIGSEQEQHSSSGIIVSTGLGSTGWFKSLLAGAVAITGELSVNPLSIQSQTQFSWDADYLFYTVREPFPSKTSSATLVFGRVREEEPLVLISQMPEAGVIFSDGIERDYLEFNSGALATITLADQKGHLVV